MLFIIINVYKVLISENFSEYEFLENDYRWEHNLFFGERVRKTENNVM